jgi:hypothetical protein
MTESVSANTLDNRRNCWHISYWTMLLTAAVSSAQKKFFTMALLVSWSFLVNGFAGTVRIDWSQFVSKDPAFLYLSFTQKSFAPAGVMTWLHPTEKRSGSYWETNESNQEQEARAFAFRLIREAPEGYEVSFQPIDPKTEQPLRARDIRIFFPRSTSKPTPLTDRTFVAGFYGNPLQRPP